MATMKRSNVTMLLLVAILVFGCKAKDEVIPNYYIDEGCLPAQIALDESLLGGYIDNYAYKNGLLESYGGIDYKYANGLVERITLGPRRYEKYTYDDERKIIRSEQFRKDNEVEGFKIVFDVEYIYNNQTLVKAIDDVDNEYHEFFYQNNSLNIDSLKTYKEGGQLLKTELFEYDEFNNIYKNLRTPKFNYFWNLKHHTTNNIKKHTIISFEGVPDTIIFVYTFGYNGFGFPMTVKSSWNSIKRISYINCK